MLLDNDIGWVFDRDRMTGPRADGNHLYALTTCGEGDLMSLKKADVGDRLVAALRAGYPAAREARVLDVTVVPWTRSTFSSRIGMSTIRPGNRTALPILVLAGLTTWIVIRACPKGLWPHRSSQGGARMGADEKSEAWRREMRPMPQIRGL